MLCRAVPFEQTTTLFRATPPVSYRCLAGLHRAALPPRLARTICEGRRRLYVTRMFPASAARLAACKAVDDGHEYGHDAL